MKSTAMGVVIECGFDTTGCLYRMGTRAVIALVSYQGQPWMVEVIFKEAEQLEVVLYRFFGEAGWAEVGSASRSKAGVGIEVKSGQEASDAQKVLLAAKAITPTPKGKYVSCD